MALDKPNVIADCAAHDDDCDELCRPGLATLEELHRGFYG